MKKYVTFFVSVVIILLPLKSQEMWEKLNNPTENKMYSAFVKLHNDEYYVSNGEYLYISLDSTETWKKTKIFDENSGPIHSLNVNKNGDIYVGTCGNGLWKSSDKGDTWYEMAGNLTQGCVQAIICIDGSNVYAYSWNYIIKSTDNGQSWGSIKFSEYPEGCRWNTFIKTQNNTFFIAYNMDDLLKSTDDCQTWERNSIPYDTSEFNFERITTDNDNNVFVVANHKELSNNKIFKTTDLGLSWIELTKDLLGYNNGFIFALPNGDLIVGSDYYNNDSNNITEIKIYKRDNKWYNINYNLPQNRNISDITFDSQGRLIVAQNEGFLYRSRETYENLVDVEEKVIDFSVFNIYPNPTDGTINLRYRIETAGIINIFLSDILGNQTLLKSEYKFPGDYVETFNLNIYPQGIYNIVLQTENRNYSGNVIINR